MSTSMSKGYDILTIIMTTTAIRIQLMTETCFCNVAVLVYVSCEVAVTVLTVTLTSETVSALPLLSKIEPGKNPKLIAI